jgi:hypothetical protein
MVTSGESLDIEGYCEEKRFLSSGQLDRGSDWPLSKAKILLMTRRAARESTETEPQLRVQKPAWCADYNQCRPHSALGYQTPAEFAATWRAWYARQAGSKHLRYVQQH